MSRDTVTELVVTLNKMKAHGAFKNYIEYIEFPFYKNLVEKTRINFSFPMTIFVGKNGSGKSSTLHALYGAPFGYTCGDYWFSTEVDPILESGDRNRFFYGYKEDRDSEIKEVMKTRMKRGSKTKKEDHDYWETSRPRLKDGMLSKVRENPVGKEVIYLDFRAEVGAFDKVFYFSESSLEERKKRLRERSKYLSRLFQNESMRFPGKPDCEVGTVKDLPKEDVEVISKILGKNYVQIRVAEHKIFKNEGVSIYMKTRFSNRYSEANAGSGEVSVVQLVRHLQEAKEYSFVLLDEPEVSIHPGAQEKLKEYLLEIIKEKKLQVVISTHSPILIENMPNSAIKLFKTNTDGKFYVKEDIHFQEAFYDIEDKVFDQKVIFCEDYAAKMIIEKILKKIEKEQYFEVIYLPGGEKTLVNHYMTPFALNEQFQKNIFLILDGDMKRDYVFVEQELTLEQHNNPKYLLECVEKAYGMTLDAFPDAGRNGKRMDQECEAYICYLSYYMSNIFFLSERNIPEEILLMSNYVKENYTEILNNYSEITSENAKEVVREISICDHDDENHIKDTISMLANKWSMEDSAIKSQLIADINSIFER